VATSPESIGCKPNDRWLKEGCFEKKKKKKKKVIMMSKTALNCVRTAQSSKLISDRIET
jgi:hypothetical protein